MSDEEVDRILGAAKAPSPVQAVVLQRIADSVHSSLRPVRVLPPEWALTGGLALIWAAVAVAAAAFAGFYGFAKLIPWERMLVFSTLGALVWVSGRELIGQLNPGSRRLLPGGGVVSVIIGALLAVFAFVFRDYRTDHFLAAGIACLLTGLTIAVPAALLSWLLVRRGFAVNPVAAGVVGGATAGLSGVAMLELHCPNFQALHVLVWHTAVVPVSGVAGGLLVWALRGRWDRL